MQQCILVRHAHAEWPGYTGRDFDRPLTERGRTQAIATAKAIAAADLHPVLVLASPALRTRQTAALIAGQLGLATDAIHLIEALYNANPATLEAALRNAAGTGLTMIVAHNPGISELASRLTGARLSQPLAPADWLHVTLQ